MDVIFDEVLVNSFYEVVKESVLEFCTGNGLTSFQERLRDGMNDICSTIQKRLLEMIDSQL